jgi:L-threonylcarbamoyladenylate synthase
MTAVLTVEPAAPDAGAIARAAAVIRAGGLVAFPTETVYGLGANALDDAAVRRVFAAKERAASDPLILHVLGVGELPRVARDAPPLALALAERCWPGPLTLVLRRGPEVAPAVSGGLDTVAVRAPSHAVARALIAAAGVPIAAPSANRFTRTSATTAAHVLEDLGGRIDLVLDGGPAPVGVESTVVALEDAAIRVLRPGAVTVEALAAIAGPLGATVVSGAAPGGAAAGSPGLLAKHYAPRKPLTYLAVRGPAAVAALRAFIAETRASGGVPGLLLTDELAEALGDELAGAAVERVGPAADGATVAHRLFAALRALDGGPATALAAAQPEPAGLGAAIDDRLRRAAVRITGGG